MAESFRDGASPLMVSRKKRKFEGEPGERKVQDPVEGLVKPSTSADPDLDIFTSGSKSTQASNPDLLSSIDFEEGKQKDGDDDFAYDGSMAKRSLPQKKPRLGEPEGEDLQRVEKTSVYFRNLDPAPQEGSKSDSEAKLGEAEGEERQGEKDPSSCVPVLLPNLDTEGSESSSKPKPDIIEFLMRSGTRPRRITKTRALPRSKSGFSVVSNQTSSSISGEESLPLDDLEEEEEDEDDSPMPEEKFQEWWNQRWERGEVPDEVPDSPGWGFSDLDEDDPEWHIKWREKFRRETPPKYRAIMESDYCPPGVEKKDEALWERYLKQIEESEGYDITDFPGPTLVCPVTPVRGFKNCPLYVEAYNGYADAAIKKFNSDIEEEDDQYEVHDILTVNVSSGGCNSTMHFMTFEAKKKNSAPAKEEDHGRLPILTTFQARVFENFATGEVNVEDCRIKAAKHYPA